MLSVTRFVDVNAPIFGVFVSTGGKLIELKCVERYIDDISTIPSNSRTRNGYTVREMMNIKEIIHRYGWET